MKRIEMIDVVLYLSNETVSANNGVKSYDVISGKMDRAGKTVSLTLKDLTTEAPAFEISGDKLNEYTYEIVEMPPREFTWRPKSKPNSKGRWIFGTNH